MTSLTANGMTSLVTAAFDRPGQRPAAYEVSSATRCRPVDSVTGCGNPLQQRVAAMAVLRIHLVYPFV